MIADGTPYEGKLSRTVWGGGKLGDYIKELPIVKNVYPAEFSAGVAYIDNRCETIQKKVAEQHRPVLQLSCVKAIPHRACAEDALSDFSSDCIEIPQAYYRMSRDFCAR